MVTFVHSHLGTNPSHGIFTSVSVKLILMEMRQHSYTTRRFIPDSPRWMLLHGRVKKSKEILLKSAEVNKRAVPEDIDLLLSIAATAW